MTHVGKHFFFVRQIPKVGGPGNYKKRITTVAYEVICDKECEDRLRGPFIPEIYNLTEAEEEAQKPWTYKITQDLNPLGKKVCVSAHIEPKEAE